MEYRLMIKDYAGIEFVRNLLSEPEFISPEPNTEPENKQFIIEELKPFFKVTSSEPYYKEGFVFLLFTRWFLPFYETFCAWLDHMVYNNSSLWYDLEFFSQIDRYHSENFFIFYKVADFVEDE